MFTGGTLRLDARHLDPRHLNYAILTQEVFWLFQFEDLQGRYRPNDQGHK